MPHFHALRFTKPTRGALSTQRIMERSSSRYVVALDFGTTFSGFAYTLRRHGNSSSPKIEVFYNWPEQGQRSYCKTPTALYYESYEEKGPYTVAAWGWPALVTYANVSRNATSVHQHDAQGLHLLKLAESSSPVSTSARPCAQYGLFVEHFKLQLNGDSHLQPLRLPESLTAEQLVVDYLRQMRKFIIDHLRSAYDNHLDIATVEWCLTVPSIWNEKAKQKMKVCAEKAGLVQGKHCPTDLVALASPNPIDIILEPEAASIYCQQEAEVGMDLRKGDKLLVADVGGGTIDFVVHAKFDDDPASTKVVEVEPSFGDLGGGTFVDRAFSGFLSTKIGCFEEVCRREPRAVLSISERWESQKKDFKGRDDQTQYFDISVKISRLWKEHDEKYGKLSRDEDYYSQIALTGEDCQRIFDTEVNKVVDLIETKMKGVKVIMVVGGFAMSPYLRRRIQEKLTAAGYNGNQILFPKECDVAICSGAVRLHLQNDSIQARISRKTLGIRVHRAKKRGDPPQLLFKNEVGTVMCHNCFKMFVKKGDKVSWNKQYSLPLIMVKRDQEKALVSLYSSEQAVVPKFVSDEGCVWEGNFWVDVNQDVQLGMKRMLEVIMLFGTSLITVSVVRKNFGDTQNSVIGTAHFTVDF